MTAVSEPDKSAASDPRTTGLLTKFMSKAFGRMTSDERTEMMQDAAALTSNELGKADAALAKTDNMSTVDSAHTGFIEDHWSDKPPDVLRTDGSHGPGSSVPSHTVNVGPQQMASGDGAHKMEREYSRYAPQTGFMAAIEKLGRELNVAKSAMKSMLEAIKSTNTQLEMLKASSATPDLQPLIEAAVSKAMAPLKADLHKALSKAAEKDDGEDDEEAKSAALLAKADEKEKKKEWKDEDDDESEVVQIGG